MPSRAGRATAIGRLLVVIALALLAGAPAAPARDTLAPAGSSDHWLPREDWVQRHWVPFDEYALRRELGLRGRDLEAYLFDDRRTLAALAAVKGIALEPLVDRLVEPMRAASSPELLALLRDRAERMLTQGHLAQHVLFHEYHYLDVRAHAQRLFGMAPRAYWHARLRGATPRALARKHGKPLAGLRAGLDALFLADLRDGESTGRANPAEAQIMLARRQRDLPCWLTRPVPGEDPSQPYTEQHRIRGRAAAVRTVRELRADERLIERYRRALPRTCWRVPPPWRGPRVAPQPPEPAARVARAAVPGYSCELDRSRSA